MTEPYKIENVKKLAPLFEKFLKENCKGYKYPEIIVAIQQALYTAIYWQSQKIEETT